VGGASQDGDFRHQLDPRGLRQANYGYTGIVVAALARYNPFAVVLVAFLLGGLLNAGYTLQGADFPSGLVGVMQGLILFCALGGDGCDPCVPGGHPAGEPDRLRSRPDDLRRRGRALVVPRERPAARRLPGEVPVSGDLSEVAAGPARSRADRLRTVAPRVRL